MILKRNNPRKNGIRAELGFRSDAWFTRTTSGHQGRKFEKGKDSFS